MVEAFLERVAAQERARVEGAEATGTVAAAEEYSAADVSVRDEGPPGVDIAPAAGAGVLDSTPVLQTFASALASTVFSASPC